MLDFFRAVGDFIQTCYHYIQLLVQNLLLIPAFFEQAVGYIGEWVMYLPETMILFIVVILSLCVVFLLLGR